MSTIPTVTRAHWLVALTVSIFSVCSGPVAAAPSLPNARAYELVSPASKAGGDVMADSARTRASSAGGAVVFSSLTAFGDARGSGVAVDYISRRTVTNGSNGWTTHAITPRQESLSFLAAFQALDPLYEGEFTDDLSTGIFRAYSPLTDAPNVELVENLYVRRDLLTAGAGSYELLSDAVAPPLLTTVKPFLAGASEDFTHVIFETINTLTADPVNFNPKLYEWDNGTVRLAGILPNGAPASSSVAGANGAGSAGAQFYTPNAISDDGSRIFFTGSSPGLERQLYMRTNHTTTVRINTSEKPTPDASTPATYEGATPDGSKIFFQTVEQLTEDDTNNLADLYKYDASLPDAAANNLTRLTIDNEPGDEARSVRGVIGSSDDGEHVYFLAAGQLEAGAPLLDGDIGIYLWHSGTITYIGTLNDLSDVELNTTATNNWNLVGLFSRVTPDGRHLLFTSQSGAGLLSFDHGDCQNQGFGGCKQLYLYSADTDALVCVSCSDGEVPGSDALFKVKAGTGASNTTWHLNHPLSDNGEHVFFTTGEALVPEDGNGSVRDVYEYDATSGKAHLLSSGSSKSNSYFLDASKGGEDVFFITREKLVGWDVDENYDLYDARSGGGFPEPAAVGTDTCSGDACQAVTKGPPTAGPIGSATFAGRGNVQPNKPKASKRKRCGKGRVKVKVKGKTRCVKRALAPKKDGNAARGHRRPR